VRWLLLAAAIVSEVLGTLSLRASDGFTRVIPSTVTVIGYVAAFALLSQVLKEGVPVGVAYGIWAGSGVALVALFGKLLFGDPLTYVMGIGMGLIIGGVLMVELGAHSGST
jgi:small multidrug resistance pump